MTNAPGAHVVLFFSVSPQVGKTRIAQELFCYLWEKREEEIAQQQQNRTHLTYVGADLLDYNGSNDLRDRLGEMGSATKQENITTEAWLQKESPPRFDPDERTLIISPAVSYYNDERLECERRLDEPMPVLQSHELERADRLKRFTAKMEKLRQNLIHARDVQNDLLRRGSETQDRLWNALVDLARKPSEELLKHSYDPYVIVDLPAAGPSGATVAEEWGILREKVRAVRVFVYTEFDERHPMVREYLEEEEHHPGTIFVKNWAPSFVRKLEQNIKGTKQDGDQPQAEYLSFPKLRSVDQRSVIAALSAMQFQFDTPKEATEATEDLADAIDREMKKHE